MMENGLMIIEKGRDNFNGAMEIIILVNG